ncbi:DKNYY domain-containing protein [Flavobacterium johnsoniae]|uniref:DKNYY domain-containing protein n=1 Tax=Flavobacterium johnsoniae TaxID=986 RepID=UPI0025AFC8B5|nr:DKNYY domain-containing protein [Flavobacterium johnsoniae]WJS93983.1 DKNYY domain-containing protein [Flavobacterium johnsoniae]
MIKDLGQGYKIIDNKFILRYDNEVFKKFYKIIDFETFKITATNAEFDNDGFASTVYFEDKKHIYLESAFTSFCILENAKPDDFKIVDIQKGYTFSNGNYYRHNDKMPFDLSKAKHLNDYHIQVEDQLYFGDVILIENVDLESFKIPYPDLIQNLAIDKNHVFFKGKIIPKANAQTFKILEGCLDGTYYLECDNAFYAKDDKYAYFIRTINNEVKVIKSKSLNDFHFKVIDERGYAFDNEYSYYIGKRTKL